MVKIGGRAVTGVLLLVLIAGHAAAGQWSFAVIGDNRAAFTSYRNILDEIRDQRVNPGRSFPPVELVVACGDLDPVERNYAIFSEAFDGRMPFYLPVRGNHDGPADVQFAMRTILLPYGNRLQLRDEKHMNYFADVKNARFIVLDQYSPFGKSFGAEAALKWVADALNAPDSIRHIFVAFHEPYLPGRPESDPFWNLIVGEDRVRAVFAAHTHTYERRRFPEAVTGSYYINAGNAGQSNHSDNLQTIVEVGIIGENVTFRVIQAPDGKKNFSLREEWEIKGRQGGRWQNDPKPLSALEKAAGSSAVRRAAP